jgi:hypothetical protein
MNILAFQDEPQRELGQRPSRRNDSLERICPINALIEVLGHEIGTGAVNQEAATFRQDRQPSAASPGPLAQDRPHKVRRVAGG